MAQLTLFPQPTSTTYGEVADVLGYRGRFARVLGAPGTGKTSLAVDLMVDRIRSDGFRPEQCVLLTGDRLAAAHLRQRVSAGLGGTTTEPLARTLQSLAFGILRREAALRGDPVPRLISGAEQDVVLAELLAGHASGSVPGPVWPADLAEALPTKGFRAELRDLLMRAVEHGLGPDELAALGERHGRPEWVAAAWVLAEYDDVTALARPGAYDPAAVLGAAAQVVECEAEAYARTVAPLRLVVVDGAHDLTAPGARLLTVLASGGAQLVLLGDPDSATQTFRGADPRLFVHGWPGLADGPTFVLGRRHRQPPALAAVTARVAAGIGVLGGPGHRDAVAGPRPPAGVDHGDLVAHRVADAVPGAGAVDSQLGGSAEVAVTRSAAAEAAYVAAWLRRAHLLGGVPWSAMAVIIRGGARGAGLRRQLLTAGVPVAVRGAPLPVRDEPAVRALLALLRVVLALVRAEERPLDAAVAHDLLGSVVAGADAVVVRQLRRSLRRAELAAGGRRSSDELILAALLGDPVVVGESSETAPLRRLARAIAAGHDALSAAGGTPRSVLWAVWSALGIAETWRRAALAGGPAGQRADRDLDAVLALFDAAARYEERLPGSAVAAFVEYVEGQAIGADSLVERAPDGDCVTLTTPAGAAGREWDLVAVCGVQAGVWPDLRIRGSLLGSEALVDAVVGRSWLRLTSRSVGTRATRTTGAAAARPAGCRSDAARAQLSAVRHDETRLFHVAVSRARHALLVTAVRSEDDQPSSLLDLVDPVGGTAAADGLRPYASAPRPVTLAGVVAELRRTVVAGTDDTERTRAAQRLAVLAELGVPGAAPESWWGTRGDTDERPLRHPDAPVRISPSRLESYISCPLRWLLTGCGGADSTRDISQIGTLIHEIAAEADDVEEATLLTELDRRWSDLGRTSGWLSRRDYEKARGMLGRLAAYDRQATAAGRRAIGTEVAIDEVIGRARLVGRVDRVELDADGGVHVIDVKTGTTPVTKAEVDEHPQLAAYQVAMAEGAFAGAIAAAGAASGAHPAGAALVQLGKAGTAAAAVQRQRPLAEAADSQWAHHLISAAAAGMSGASFPASPGKACHRCPVRRACPVSAGEPA